MPELPATLPQGRRNAAISEVDRWIEERLNGARLTESKLETYKHQRFDVGWEICRRFSHGGDWTLHMLADSDFPYAPPRVALVDSPGILQWPHLERDGLLCLLPPDASVDVDQPIRVIEWLIEEAGNLIEQCLAGSNSQDFRDEFQSYWSFAATEQVPCVTSLLEPKGPSRRISVWCDGNEAVLGEDRDVTERWLRNRRIEATCNSEKTFLDGLLIWLPRPPVPAEYPRTGSDLLKMKLEPDVKEMLAALTKSVPSSIVIVLGSMSANGPVFGALVVRKPERPQNRRGKSDGLTDGFRPEKIPKELLMGRYLGGSGVMQSAVVSRADPAWVHGRDNNHWQPLLHASKVAILGCGSVGSTIARLLAQSGVGNILLVDPEKLEWANISRHALGAESVGEFKARALAEQIKASFPHIRSVRSEEARVSQDSATLMANLLSYDLIISTMGHWASECFLNDWQQVTDKAPRILYGWVEAHASAAHAVVVVPGGACFRCGLDNHGRPELTVTAWPNNAGLVPGPACGASFTPYGAAELCWCHAHIAETVIYALVDPPTDSGHRIWIGSGRRIEASGGRWSELSAREFGDLGSGRAVIERRWVAREGCEVCSKDRTENP